MKKFFKSKLILQVFMASLVATLATASIVAATTTTIGANISTTGALTVTGTNTLFGATNIGGAITATSTLAVAGIFNVNGHATTTAAGVFSPASALFTTGSTTLININAAAAAASKRGIVIGATASGSGIPLTSTVQTANVFNADDGAASLTGYTEDVAAYYTIANAIDGDISATALDGFMNVTANVTNTAGSGLSGLWGNAAITTGKTITNNAIAGTDYGDIAGGHFSINLPTGAILAANSWLAGLSVGGRLDGTHNVGDDVNGNIAAIRIRKPSAGSWNYGLAVPAEAAAKMNKGIFIGADAETTGSGIPLTGASWGRSQGNAFYCDDAGATTYAGSGYTECFTPKMTLTHSIVNTDSPTTNGDVSTTAIHPDLTINASYNGIGGLSAIWGNTTIGDDKNITTTADVSGGSFGVDINGTLNTNSFAAGVSVGGKINATTGGVNDGIFTGFRIRTQTSSGVWNGVLSIPALTVGPGQSNGLVQSATSTANCKGLKVYVGTDLYTINMCKE